LSRAAGNQSTVMCSIFDLAFMSRPGVPEVGGPETRNPFPAT
jgi:hypothetical protein